LAGGHVLLTGAAVNPATCPGLSSIPALIRWRRSVCRFTPCSSTRYYGTR
jgi:hypothetical protein